MASVFEMRRLRFYRSILEVRFGSTPVDAGPALNLAEPSGVAVAVGKLKEGPMPQMRPMIVADEVETEGSAENPPG